MKSSSETLIFLVIQPTHSPWWSLTGESVSVWYNQHIADGLHSREQWVYWHVAPSFSHPAGTPPVGTLQAAFAAQSLTGLAKCVPTTP